MRERIILSKKSDETWLEWLISIYYLFKGQSHVRFAKSLLRIGFALLSPSILGEVLKYLIGYTAPPISIQVQIWTLYTGIACIAMGFIVFMVFGLLDKILTKRPDKDLRLGDPSSQAPKSLSALKYTSQVTQFVGRDNELIKLENFMEESDKPVSWWAISGKGGRGKSRLALELCNLYREKGWNVGFYDTYLAKSILTEWKPSRPHLIVLDYAGRDTGLFVEIIQNAIQLENAEERLAYPIRIILIERDAQSTIEIIGKTLTFGERIKNHLYKPSPLELMPLNEDFLSPIVSNLCEFFELPESTHKSVMAFTLNSDSERKLLIAGLAALNVYLKHNQNSDTSIEELIDELIVREREVYWQTIDVDEEREQYLIVATMADGIYLSDVDKYGQEAKEFMEDFDFHDAFGMIVGESANEKLAPLSHDVVSELYVLNSFIPSNVQDREKFNRLVKICLQINDGQGLVNFFTRAANDWPEHPSLNLLLQRFGQSHKDFNTWLILISNIIDKIELPLVDKSNLFHDVITVLHQDNPSVMLSIMHILEGFFLRVLRQATGSPLLDGWVKDYVIIALDVEALDASNKVPRVEQEGVVSVELAPNILVKPKEYCDVVLAVFSMLDETSKKPLLWVGLFEIYHHAIFHQLTNRETDLQGLKSFMSDFISTFDDEGWVVCIVFRNVVTGLVQFGHTNTKKYESIDIIDYLIECASLRSNKRGFAELLSASSSAYGHSYLSYEKRMELLLIWDEFFSEDMFTNDEVGTNFVAFSVLMMSGFRKLSHARGALEQLERAEKVMSLFPNDINIEHFNMCITQLIRRERELLLVDEIEALYEKSVSFVKNHGEQVPKIVTTLIQEIATKYTQSLREEDDNATRYMDDALSLCRYFSTKDLQSEKLYLSGIMTESLRHSLKLPDKKSLFWLCDTVNELQSMPYVDISHFWQESNCILSAYQRAANDDDEELSHLIAEVAEYWLNNLSDSSAVEGVLGYIVEDNQQRMTRN